MKYTWMTVTAAAVLAAGLTVAQTTTPMMMNRQQRFDRLATYLNLTPDQRTQAQAIMDQAKTAAQPVLAQVKAGRQQLAQAVKAGQSDAQIEQLSNQQGVLMGQLIAIRTKALEKGYALLTPDQKQKAGQLRDHLRQMFQNRFRNRAGQNG